MLVEESKLPTSSSSQKNQQSLVDESIIARLQHLQQIDQAPNILMSALEFGTLIINDQPITAKVGGLAVVINDMIKNYPRFLENRGGKISFVFMAYDGIPETNYVRSFQIEMAGWNQEVHLFKHLDEDGATIYFLDHPLFKRRAINDPNCNLYIDRGGNLYSGRHEWEEAFTLSLFNKAVAKVRELIDANIYHAHDYHTGLAALHMPRDMAITMTIHNAGPGYEGIFYTDGYGNYRMPHPDYPYGIPAGDAGANDHLLRILGVDFDTYMRYFEVNGTFKCLNILNFIQEHNMLSGIPVSTGYAKELSKDIHSMLDGIENGLSSQVKAANHPFLKKKNELELSKIHPFISNVHDRSLWRYGLNYGFDLKTEKGKDQVHKRKALLKAMLQRNAGIEINPDKPLFVLVSRLVSQKNIAILAENINHIVGIGGQVIIAGSPGDQVGRDLGGRIHYLENLPNNVGQVKFFNEFASREMSTLIQAGGDFFVITSKFEPCGLTDIEAAWLGTIPITRKTGGLGKVQNSFTYEWENTADINGEVQALRHKISEATAFYYLDQQGFKNMRINAMKEDFSWQIALDKYFENYRSTAFFKVVREVCWRYRDQEIAVNILMTIADQLPQELIHNYLRLLSKKAYLNPVEKLFYQHQQLWPSMAQAISL